MRSRTCIAAAALSAIAVLASANDVWAQDGTPTSPPPAAPGAAPAAAGSPAAVPVGGAAAPVDQDKDKEEKGRLRIGFNFLNGGVGTGGNLSGPAIGATFRIGWQLNRLMGVYGNISPFVWIASSSVTAPGGASVDIGASSGTQFTPMFSLTPADIVEVAAGPSLDYMSFGSVSSSTGAGGSTSSAAAASGVYFGLHGKVALHLGSRNEETGRRRGFTLEANLHPVFADGATVTFITGGLGYDWL